MSFFIASGNGNIYLDCAKCDLLVETQRAQQKLTRHTELFVSNSFLLLKWPVLPEQFSIKKLPQSHWDGILF